MTRTELYTTSLGLSLLGLAASILAVYLSDSLAILVECVRSAMDVLMLMVSWLLVRVGGEAHTALASRVIAVGMMLSAISLGWIASDRWQDPAPVGGPGVAINLISASISALLNTRHCVNCYRQCRMDRSPLLLSHLLLFANKLVANGLVVVTMLVITYSAVDWFDAAMALALSIVMLISACVIVFQASLDNQGRYNE